MSNKCIKHYLSRFQFSILVKALNAQQTHRPEHILIDQVKNKDGRMDDGPVLQPPVQPSSQTHHSLLDISHVSGNYRHVSGNYRHLSCIR